MKVLLEVPVICLNLETEAKKTDWPQKLTSTVKPGVSKLFGKHKKFTIARLFTIYQVIYAENGILGNIKCFLMPGC